MITALTNINVFFQAESLDKSLILLERTNERTNVSSKYQECAAYGSLPVCACGTVTLC